MSTFDDHQSELSPRANIFLLINLGCEMLYVIDQRLKAQQIAEDKSIQVIHDITAVLLERKFVDSIIVGSTHTNAQLITPEHCKFMLKDIATCSLMRLDEPSMEKLWNLMTVIYKWQIFLSKHQHHLLDITFRHLNAIGRIYQEAKRSMLIDFTKNTLLDFWNASNENEQLAIYRTNISWLQNFNTKISVLIRLGFQNYDGSFPYAVQSNYMQDFMDNIGENIYVKSAEILAAKQHDEGQIQNTAQYDVNQLAEFLSAAPQTNNFECEDLKPIDATNFQKQFETNLKQCNVLFEDLAMKEEPMNGLLLDLQLFPDSTTRNNDANGEFVQMDAIYNRNTTVDAASGSSSSTMASTIGLTKDLLDFYSNMK